MSTLKESCCELFADFLSHSAELLGEISALQKKSIAAIEGYFKSDKTAWCETASRQKLQIMQEKLAQLNENCADLIKECDQISHIL